MNLHTCITHFGRAGAVAIILGSTFPSAKAAVVWQDTFTGETDGSTPSSDYTGNGTEDWVITEAVNATNTVSGSTGNPAPSMHMVDTTTSAAASGSVSMGQFAAFDTSLPGQSTIVISFDLRVDAYLSTALNSTPQFFLRDNGATRLTIGFGRRSIADGDANSDNFLFAAAGSNPNPDAVNAIGFTGSGWETGFDFGDYSNTGTLNTTGGNFVRFELTYVNGATTASLLAVNGANSTTFTLTGLTASSFSSSSALDSLNFSTGSSATSDVFFDNIRVEIVPEPSASLLLGGSLLSLVLVRRRAVL